MRNGYVERNFKSCRNKKLILAIPTIILLITLVSLCGHEYYYFSNDNDAEGVNIAVLDSGYFKNTEVVNLIHYTKADDTTIDNLGHGTKVIDCILEKTPKAQINSLKVLDDNGKGNLKLILLALDWCINNDIDIVNMSFSMPENHPELEHKLIQLEEKGTIIVASYDNEKKRSFPAEHSFVVGVSASHLNLFGEVVRIGKNHVQTDGSLDEIGGSYNSIATARITAFIAQNLKDYNVIRRIKNE